ncbi:NADH-quinone oxidoreductase subunit C [Streptomyces massasporeus]|uniref:NADH-quinone oxidoreductase subunit C n=1 Tax=Streptomyces massasporeus TaxID=67324 RepID=UPI00370114EE
MTAVGWLPADAEELFGPDATAEESYDVLTVDVPPAAWITALETARDRLGCTYFDWLSAVDEPGTGFRVTAHVAALAPLRRLLLRTTVPHEAPALPSAVGVYAGAAWHERETHEMFGITFEGHPALDHLLLPDTFEGHPLRKDFVLAARVAKAWPGAKEPGESEHGGPKRRQMLPPGVPDPNEWGPLKGQLPPAPTRGAGRTAGDRPTRGTARPAGERPVRRARSVSEGSASQSAAGAATPTGDAGTSTGGAGTPAGGAGAPAGGTPASGARASAGPRRTRSVSEGSASQSTPDESTPPASAGPRRNRSASQGSASQQRGGSASPEPGSASPATRPASATPASASPTSDAPWHHARPAFDEQSSSTPEDPAPPESSSKPEDPAPPESSGTPGSPATPDTPGSPATPESSDTPGSPDSKDAADAQDSATEPQPTDDGVKPAAGPSKPENPENPDNSADPEDHAGGPQ